VTFKFLKRAAQMFLNREPDCILDVAQCRLEAICRRSTRKCCLQCISQNTLFIYWKKITYFFFLMHTVAFL